GAVLRRPAVGRDLLFARETDEVIEAHRIESGEGVRESLQPPAEPRPLDLRPVIERIAPALAGGAEVVWRDAGDDRGLPLAVEAEEIGMGPHVGAVVCDEDGDGA